MTKPETELSLRSLQEQHKIWSKYNFNAEYPTTTNWWKPVFGVCEEAGELCHSLLKQSEGIRGTWDHHEAKAKDAVGDLVIFLCSVCSARGWDLQEIVEDTWNGVKDRDFKKYPITGKPDKLYTVIDEEI